jgi:glucose/arabinose dehydrogenase
MSRIPILLLGLAACAPSAGGPPAPAPQDPAEPGPETISSGNVFRGSFTPGGDTLYFFKNVTEGREDYRIFRTWRTGGSWAQPEQVTLGGDFSDLYPALSPDGRRLVFSSYRPAPGDTSSHPSAYLWYVERGDSAGGAWGAPVFMAEASEWSHYHAQPAFTADGSLHFSRSGWDYRGHSEHVSRWNGQAFGAPDTSAAWLAWRGRLGPGRYLYETVPGHDGTYVLLMIGAQPAGERPGPPDIFAAFRTPTGWSEPVPLAGGVNTPATENFPFYSPGGRDLYFVRDFARIHRVPLAQALNAGRSAERGYVVDTLATGLAVPWSLATLPGGDILVTEKYGGVRLWRDGALLPRPLAGVPAAFQSEDSGLLDLALDPRFRENGLVYLSFSEGTAQANHTALFRGRLTGDGLTDGRVIFRAAPDKQGPGHPGSRIAFLPDETLLLTIGEGYDYKEQAQDLGSALGKVVRLDRDGRPAAGNPFAGRPDARPEIWSYGHRNPQGLLVDPRDGAVWEHEHGPRGGDEINRVRPGLNYGWPRTTHGVDYSGEVISKEQTARGIEPPLLVWVPSIAPSGFALYLGDRFPGWKGDFFVGGLAERSLRRVRIREGEATLQEVLLRELRARIRDVRAGPDGFLYLLTDDPQGMLLRLRPRD